jgi:hypothetical protein
MYVYDIQCSDIPSLYIALRHHSYKQERANRNPDGDINIKKVSFLYANSVSSLGISSQF